MRFFIPQEKVEDRLVQVAAIRKNVPVRFPKKIGKIAVVWFFFVFPVRMQ
jgi:hypothetical protein